MEKLAISPFLSLRKVKVYFYYHMHKYILFTNLFSVYKINDEWRLRKKKLEYLPNIFILSSIEFV